jgi:uncharacterized protein YcaQ
LKAFDPLFPYPLLALADRAVQIRKTKDLDRLKRLALASQGLIGRSPFGTGTSGAIKAIEHLSYIQLDSISVIERAHNHIWRSRVPDFRPDQSNQLLEDAQVFEYWAHAAAYLPIREYRYYLADKSAVKDGTLRRGVHQGPQADGSSAQTHCR